jgi:ABC-type Zn2+ transport system substrate-binding protein/surface adhesin
MSSESEEDSREEERHHSRLTNIWKSIQQTKNISQTLDHRQHATTPSHHDYKQNLAHLLAKVQGL